MGGDGWSWRAAVITRTKAYLSLAELDWTSQLETWNELVKILWLGRFFWTILEDNLKNVNDPKKEEDLKKDLKKGKQPRNKENPINADKIEMKTTSKMKWPKIQKQTER